MSYRYSISMVYEVEFFFTSLSFKYLFTSAAVLRYLSFLAVLLDIDTSQFFFILTAKLMVLSAIC